MRSIKEREGQNGEKELSHKFMDCFGMGICTKQAIFL